MRIYPRFYSSSLPLMLEDAGDKDYPRRISMEMNEFELKRFIEELESIYRQMTNFE